MEKIIFLPEVLDYFDKLVGKLFEKKYFGFEDSAYFYVEEIVYFVYENIELSNHLKSPKELRNIGEFYIFYKPNHRTTWYILFDKVDETFLVTYIFNNHSKESSFI